MNSQFEKLKVKIQNRNSKIAVIGIGRVGLPLALSFSQVDFNVVGLDVNQEYVETINSGVAPFLEDGLPELLTKSVENEKFIASYNIEDVRDSDIIIIAVGTPLTSQYQPDLGGYISVLQSIAPMVKDKLIISRTTSSPNTFNNYLIRILEDQSKLTEGNEFWAAVCPERIVEGKALTEIPFLPEIIGSNSSESFELSKELFLSLNKTKLILKSTPTEAELAKLFCNVYRYVNFAVANEFSLLCENLSVDPYNTIRIANEGYSRGGIPIPGLAGGPCLSKDGYFLIQDNLYTEFIMAAWRINEFLPNYLVEKLKKVIISNGKMLLGTKIGLLGLSFKAKSDDLRYSPAVAMKQVMENSGMKVRVHDPYVNGTEDFDAVTEDADVIVIAVNHPEFKNIESRLNESSAPLILDCWGLIDLSKVGDKQIIRIGN